MPVGVFYDPETQATVIGSAADTAASKKFRDARRRPDVAVVVNDLAAVDLWTPRGIEIRGRAETHTGGGEEVGRRLAADFPFNRMDPHPPAADPVVGIHSGSFALSARDVT
jgi:pyridoxamine 5'-phosphate oxidase family protein